MADTDDALPTDFARRDFMLGGAGLAAMTTAILQPEIALAQAGAAAPAPAAAPGKVALERRGAVLLMGIDRPETQNRIDPPIIIGLGKALYQLEHDDELRVAVLHGLGPDFSMGIDPPAFIAAVAAGVLPVKDPDYIGAFGLTPPLRTKPLVVAVQGGTQFGGHELFLAADVRVAASDAIFRQAEVTRGTFPGGGATVRFPREAGWANAMRYMLTGDMWGAAEALRMGLVHEVTEPGKQLDIAVGLASRIAATAPLGVRAVLASAREALTPNEASALAAAQPTFLRLQQTEDFKEFQRALRESRAPVFRGR
jgi:enoyl-CoA hydratase/carnithine racemase